MKAGTSLLLLGCTLALLSVPANVAAQFHLDVTPFAGGGRQAVSTGLLPAGAQAMVLDTHTVLGLAAELSWDGLPLALRVSSSRGFGAKVFAWEGRERVSDSSQGIESSSATRHELGSASVSAAWADVVVSPFSWSVAPYGFFGFGRQWLGYEDEASGVARPGAFTMQRYGLGLDMDFNFARRSSLRLEAAAQGGARLLGVESHEMPEYLQLTMGVRLPVF